MNLQVERVETGYRTPQGTTSQQRSTLPASRQGHGLSPELKAQKSRVLTCRWLPGTESAGWPTR